MASTSEYDLLPKVIPYLDRHMIFPLLDFRGRQLLNEEVRDDAKLREITEAKYALLKHTDMTEYVAQLYKDIHGLKEAPAEFQEKEQQVISRLESYEQQTEVLSEVLKKDEVIATLRSDKVANLEFLKRDHGVTLDMVNALYDYGQLQYSCGNYEDASETLYKFRVLSTDNDKVTWATWGRLACETLTANWDTVMEELQKVREGIDAKLSNNPLAQLQHRTSLIHWALFPLFNATSARETVLELFFNAGYINTIQVNCPWIIRYLAVAVITNRGRARNAGIQQKQMKDVIRVVKQEVYQHQDPITRFVHALYVDFEFEEAQNQLVLAEEVLRRDFFLAAHVDDFVDSARHLIFESYCKIHVRISLKDLSARLGLDAEAAEKWIVNLIRETRLDAKIDYKEGTVVMNHPPTSVHQQVIERTKGGFFRTQVLSSAIAK